MRTEKEYNGILFDQLEILERIEEIAENGSPEDIKKAIETKAVYKKKATPFVESIDPRKPSTGSIDRRSSSLSK